MTDKDLKHEFGKLDSLYAEHARNQSEEDRQEKDKLRIELLDMFLSLKPQIKKHTQLQWYEPTYNFAITGNLDYIEEVRKDLAQIIGQLSN
jgi:hypothetical protein